MRSLAQRTVDTQPADPPIFLSQQQEGWSAWNGPQGSRTRVRRRRPGGSRRHRPGPIRSKASHSLGSAFGPVAERVGCSRASRQQTPGNNASRIGHRAPAIQIGMQAYADADQSEDRGERRLASLEIQRRDRPGSEHPRCREKGWSTNKGRGQRSTALPSSGRAGLPAREPRRYTRRIILQAAPGHILN